MLSFLLTVYTIVGLSVMAFIVVNIAFENKFTKFQIKCMKIFPIHTLLIFVACVISYSAYYYIEKIAKRQEGMMSKENNNKYFVLRRKGYTKGDRWGFHEYISYNCEFTGKPLDKPETSWERLKYAEIFESHEDAKICKDLVDTEDVWLDIVCLRKAEEDY